MLKRISHRQGVAVLLVAALAILLVPALPASAAARSSGSGSKLGTYLALGDSVAFGYQPPNATPPPNYLDAASFVGYPELAGQSLRYSVVNASCPGETTVSMIAAGGISNGCENILGVPGGYRTAFPLHVKYSGTQLQFAVHYLTTHPSTSLVSIDIGANDAFVCEETTKDGCMSEFPALLAQIKTNLEIIYAALRYEAGYKGPIVALTYYSTTYTVPLMVAEVRALNKTIASATKQYGGLIANGFVAFERASKPFGGNPCTAGLLIPVPGGCNIHPSPEGALLLAAAVAQAIGR
jgi:lysophospholipase L1-like esterase